MKQADADEKNLECLSDVMERMEDATGFSAQGMRDFVRRSRAVREDVNLEVKTTEEMLKDIDHI